MRRCLILVVVVLTLSMLASCSGSVAVVGEPRTYEVTSEIHSLDIEINAADFTIVHGDKFSVESNLRDLSVSEKNGVLIIKEKSRVFSVSDTNAQLQLCIPGDVVFDQVKITTGAGRLTADSLTAEFLDLKLGAGMVRFDALNACSGINLEGGTGEIIISSGELNDLNLRLGVGRFTLTAALNGNSHLQFGVGEAILTLVGDPGDYALDVTKGIGSIDIDGYTGANISSGNPRNYVKIQGGIGTANIGFQN